MACKNENCCRRTQPSELPTAALSVVDAVSLAADIVQHLSLLKKLGINFLPAASRQPLDIAQLLGVLQTLLLENKILRNQPPTPTVTATNDGATIAFGPKQNYELHLAVSDAHDRALLAAQFRTAAEKLVGPVTEQDTKPLPNQQMPLFDEYLSRSLSTE